MAKKKKNKTVVDTSTCGSIRERLHKESINKIKAWQNSIKEPVEPLNGTRRNLSSIIAKATKKGKVVAEKIQAEDDRRAKKKAKIT